MALPIRTTLEDIQKLAEFLSSKTLGCTIKEAKSVLDKKYLDGRKLAALKLWDIINEEGDKLKVTTKGREYAKGDEDIKAKILREAIKKVPAYYSIIERVSHRKETSLTTVDVGVHWTEFFKNDASTNETILSHQAVCFFQLAQGSKFGTLKAGRKGYPTRFEFILDSVNSYVANQNNGSVEEDQDVVIDENKSSDNEIDNEEVGGSNNLVNQFTSRNKGVTINLNIQLNVPETTDDKVYDKFFEAMKKHLLS